MCLDTEGIEEVCWASDCKNTRHVLVSERRHIRTSQGAGNPIDVPLITT